MFIDTEEYKQLPMDYPGCLTPQRAYRALCGYEHYEPGVSKAICLSRSAYRYNHAILSKLVNGRDDSTIVLSIQELLYLYSIVQNEPLYLRHIFVEYLCHYGQYTRVGVLFSGPYITRVIVVMGLMDVIRGAEKIRVPSPLGLETMHLMGMIRRYGDRVYVMIMSPLELAEGEGDTAKGS